MPAIRLITSIGRGTTRCRKTRAYPWIFIPAAAGSYSSWPNWIEAEFAALRYFALSRRTDHRSLSSRTKLSLATFFEREPLPHTQRLGRTVSSKIHGRIPALRGLMRH